MTLRSDGDGTRLRLVHRDLPAGQVESHSKGWAGMLDRLNRAVVTYERPDQHTG
ncbi:MAG: SRPBCC domain-containing protein [Thermoleophilaceae bacterium]|nr:SRPBCC domain-containing protein [Thermoleophilaceae bacterium]